MVKKIAKSLMSMLILFLVSLVLLLVSCQSKLIYMPRKYEAVEVAGANARPVSYATSQGKQTAWVHPVNANGDGLIWLVFGGNGMTALDWQDYFTSPLLRQDTFVLFDYPGYGQSEGRPTPASISESVTKLLPALATEFKTSEESIRPRLRVFAQSLGCAAALMAVEAHQIPRGVLIAPFTTMRDMARQVVGWPLCEVLHHRFDNVATLSRLEKREGLHLNILHGSADEMIPVEMGRMLGSRFPRIVRFEEVPGARHNDILNTDRDKIEAAMAACR
ncbi:MAG: hypothetical protein RL693_352 [Verrucomicrobiota bacterium]|jgi:pimeloyl-ACP methyl ester carboxylesterase